MWKFYVIKQHQYGPNHLKLLLCLPNNRKNEEDLERSKDMLQRELRAILELEGICKNNFWKTYAACELVLHCKITRIELFAS